MKNYWTWRRRLRDWLGRLWFRWTTNADCSWCGQVVRRHWWAKQTTSVACPTCMKRPMKELEKIGQEPKPEPKKKRQPVKTPAAGRGRRRNQKCYCGSGKKFKHCCLASAQKQKQEAVAVRRAKIEGNLVEIMNEELDKK